MDDHHLSLHKIQISGPTLASLLHRLSSSSGDLDGLLFGRVSHLTPSTLSDDTTTPTTTTTTLIATITSFFSSTSPTSFYSPSGHLLPPSLHHLLSSLSSPDPLIGWFSARRKSPLRPSLRESTLTSSLSSNNNINININTNNNNDNTFPPCIFLLLTTPFRDELIDTYEYKAFQFRTSSGVFEPKTLDVVNLGPAFRGHYGNFTPNSRFPDLPFEVKGLGNESMVEDEGKDENEKFGLVCDNKGFGVERLKGLMGAQAAGYTAELEELYGNMIKKMNGLARVVEQSSARVLEQEKHNMKLRYKVAGIE